MRKLLFAAGTLAAISVAVGAATRSPKSDIARNLDIFTSVYKTLQTSYVDTIDAQKSITTAIAAMLDEIDPYTEYFPEQEQEEFMATSTGEYGGIGSMIMEYDGKVMITEPNQGSPAMLAGLLPGDVFVAIDGDSVKGLHSADISKRLKGQAGTPVKVTVKRPYPKAGVDSVLTFDITREKIEINPVPYYGVVRGDIGYIALTTFNEKSFDHVRDALKELRSNPKVKSIALDLRNNGGGIMESAVQITGLFVPKGTEVLRTRGKGRLNEKIYKTTQSPVDTEIPLVVMINGNSASAAEIVAGALQDLDRAVVVGDRSFGKGLVQSTMGMPYNGMLKVTMAKYYIPSGRCIQAIDYSRRNPDGTVAHIPDSLTTVWHTRAGREVRDGRGISPDVKVEADSVANIVYYLSANNYVGIPRDSSEVMLQYEIDYQARHATVAGPEEFSLTDDDWAEFKRRVLASGFKYDRESEKYLKDLEKLARFEGYYDDARPEFEALARKLSHNVEHDLDYNREAICHLIADHLMAAYYYQRGSAAYALRHDKQMDEALRLLADESRYHSLLKP